MDSLLLSAEDAAKLLGIGRSHFYGLHSSGRLGPLPVKLGRRSLWSRMDLEFWVSAGCPARGKWQEEKKYWKNLDNAKE
ncbi:MAG: helix-turn-helix transcriptional regulator [Planctomycetota bacterium]|jgi:excisionase family DNA binding protein